MELWRMFGWGRRESCLVVFVPYGRLGSADLVAGFYRLFKSMALKAITVRLIEDAGRHFLESLRGALLEEPPGKMILFAHGHPENLGFQANASVEQPGEVLLHRWFETAHGSYGVLLAQACRGAVILSSSPWRRTFPEWVSYRGPLRAFLGSELGESRWMGVLRDLVGSVSHRSNVRAMKEELSATFHRGMASTYDKYDPAAGDALNIMYFQECLESVACSEDDHAQP